jgi:hypothetical protein
MKSPTFQKRSLSVAETEAEMEDAAVIRIVIKRLDPSTGW